MSFKNSVITNPINFKSFLRKDGRKGIRNITLVVPLVECAAHVAESIIRFFDESMEIHLLKWSGCYPNDYGKRMIEKISLHPNVGAVLFVSLGCEGMDRESLKSVVKKSGRWTETLVIQENKGTLKSIEKGIQLLKIAHRCKSSNPETHFYLNDLTVGLICGGSDATSGISANPALGKAVDELIKNKATVIFEETGELIGCEELLKERCKSNLISQAVNDSIKKASDFYKKLGHASISNGNHEGGLTTIEEKSLGAYAKSGSSLISGVISPGDSPPTPGLYLLDVVPEGDPVYGFPNVNDNAEIMELIACGCHLIIFTTGRGSVVGSAVSPVLKVCGNPTTYKNLAGDMDINAGNIILGKKSIEEVGLEIFNKVKQMVSGKKSMSELLGHRESTLVYKDNLPLKTSC